MTCPKKVTLFMRPPWGHTSIDNYALGGNNFTDFGWWLGFGHDVYS